MLWKNGNPRKMNVMKEKDMEWNKGISLSNIRVLI
jgi:hypothetical protein